MPPRQFRGPLMLIAFSMALAIALNAGFTLWAIGYHSQQGCTELHILATTKGASTPYDQAIRSAYQRLFTLRCT